MSVFETHEDDRAEGSVVEVEGLKKYFPIDSGFLSRKTEKVRAVDGVDFDIPEGETFGLVGESGSGKTTVGRTILRLTEPTAGSIRVAGYDVPSLTKREIKAFRRDAQIVYQDPASSLNPRHRVKDIVEAPLKIHGIGTKKERIERVRTLLEMVDLPAEYLYKYPTALSGGQKQRVGIARAVVTNPKFVVLDEPTSALDVSVQARIVDILEELQDEFGITFLFITHNLPLLKNVADHIGVMYLGRLVEVGPAAAVFDDPQHPYTKALLSSIPTITEEDARLTPDGVMAEGEVPDPREKPSGCAFRSRCPEEFSPCADEEPGMYQRGPNHQSRCFLHEEEYTD